jgi:hypothetical protein
MLFVSLLFWGFLASYVIHILDEALLNGGFVKWIADNFWPISSVSPQNSCRFDPIYQLIMGRVLKQVAAYHLWHLRPVTRSTAE